MSQSQETGERGSTASGPPGMPRWVKVFGIIFIVLVVLAGIILITGTGGEHGPGRHVPAGEAGETLASRVTQEGMPPGEGGGTALGGQTAPTRPVVLPQ